MGSSKKEIKIAIIGAGRWSEVYCRTLAQFPNIKLVALLRRRQERPGFIPDGCQMYTDIDAMFHSHIYLDGVIVATASTGDMALECLKYNIPVLAEKPLLTDRRGLKKWKNIDTSKLLVNYTHLFSPAFLKLQEIVQNKEILGIHSEGFNNGPVRQAFSSLWDYAPHDLSLIFSLMEEKPNKINIIEHKADNDRSLYEISLKYSKFHSSTIVGNGAEKKARSIRVIFEDNDLKEVVYDDMAADKLILDGEPVEIINTQPLHNTIQAFISLINGKEDGRFGLTMTKKITDTLSEFWSGRVE